MEQERRRFDEMKRRVYQVVLPILAVALGMNTVLQAGQAFSLYTNLAILGGVIVCWFLLLTKFPFVITEWTMLTLAGLYLLSMLLQALYFDMLGGGEPSLGDFIIWMPLIVIATFLVLDKRQAAVANGVLLLLLIAPVIPAWGQLDSRQLDSVLLMYIALVVYTFVFYFLNSLYLKSAEQRVLTRYAYLDALTGIANRHQIDLWLTEYIAAGEREGTPFSVLFFDLDHFKCVNDEHGHRTGDDVLKQLAEVVKNELGERDLFGRWGGEEFIVLTCSGENEAAALAERLRAAIEAHHFGSAGRLTASFGIAGNRPDDTPESIQSRADERLYQSKEDGRNRITGWMDK
ncbi:GGDEF domain-containing protein [Edaphobacillus lindanitolerans]|uniref:Diguanylate cyclase (GGDEF) domain-containing protein n=1 Tax=Edaphobacillus lindanitolerans TaxID=550447 RepID=A0A1U7PS46_9BACI|nr:GGDEF domain-containing protein [Edaphobacillus lindanitolerans]SIT88603.1 diguanylate cyclase (GGDEF) domain-containing protein [Edaphobacillus lindanitolerans]